MRSNSIKHSSSSTTIQARVRSGAGAALLLLAACRPAPLWIAVADDSSITISGPGITVRHPIAADRLQWARDGQSLFAVSHPAPAVLEITRIGGVILRRFPLGTGQATQPVIDRRGRRLFVGTGNTVHAFQVSPLEPAFSVDVCEDAVSALTLFDPSHKLFVTCEDGVLSEIDIPLRRVLRTTRIDAVGACDPRDLTLSPNLTVIIVACSSGRLLYLDRMTLGIIDSLHLTTEVSEMRVEGSRRRLVLTASSGSPPLLVDVRMKTITPLAITQQVTGMTWAADGSLLLLRAEGAVLRTRPGTQVVDSLSGTAGGRAIAVWPERTPVMRWSRLPPLPAPQPS